MRVRPTAGRKPLSRMDLSNLKPAKGSTRSRKRIARGQGSGYGGHSSTKGNKGQKARSGANIPSWFEGGQMPLQRRVPKFGFKNRFRVAYQPINVGRLERLVSDGAIDEIGRASCRERGEGKDAEQNVEHGHEGQTR